MDNVDLRLLDRFRIAQQLNRGGRDELRALDDLRARVEGRSPPAVRAITRPATVIEFPSRH